MSRIKHFIFIIAIFVIGFSSLNAQKDFVSEKVSSKGSRMWSVLGGFSSLGGDAVNGSDRVNNISVNLDYRFFVMDGLALGADIDFERLWQGNDSQIISGVGPEVAYFFEKENAVFSPFVSANYNFVTLAVGGDSVNGWRFGLNGGVVFTTSGKVGGVLEIGYQSEKYSNGGNSLSINQFAVLVGISVSIW